MIRTSIAAAVVALAAAATPSFAGPYGNDRPSQYGGYGRVYDGDDGSRLVVNPYSGQITADEAADGDNCGFHRRARWGSYGRRIVRRTNDGTYYGSNYGRRNDY